MVIILNFHERIEHFLLKSPCKDQVYFLRPSIQPNDQFISNSFDSLMLQYHFLNVPKCHSNLISIALTEFIINWLISFYLRLFPSFFLSSSRTFQFIGSRNSWYLRHAFIFSYQPAHADHWFIGSYQFLKTLVWLKHVKLPNLMILSPFHN